MADIKINKCVPGERFNGDKGWSAQLTIDAETINGRTLLKLSDWIGGTGTKPTANVGQWIKEDGTFTNLPYDAYSIKGEKGDRGEKGEVIIPNVSFEIDEDMNLIQTTDDAYEGDFSITEQGDLIITF